MKTCLCLCLVFEVLTSSLCSIAQINEKCAGYRKLFGNSSAIQRPLDEVQVGEFPHVAVLGYREGDSYMVKCGAVIVSKKYVMAPAHCAVYDPAKLEFVRVGVNATPTTVANLDIQSDYKIREVKVHPNYNRRAKKHNIALLELEKEIEFNNRVRPACLDTRNETGDLVLTEWGEHENDTKLVLHKATVNPLSNENCNTQYLSKTRSQTVDDSQLCAITECSGNLGGPLQVQNRNLYTLVALPSYGIACRLDHEFPTVYTKIYNYLYWIENIVWP